MILVRTSAFACNSHLSANAGHRNVPWLLFACVLDARASRAERGSSALSRAETKAPSERESEADGEVDRQAQKTHSDVVGRAVSARLSGKLVSGARKAATRSPRRATLQSARRGTRRRRKKRCCANKRLPPLLARRSMGDRRLHSQLAHSRMRFVCAKRRARRAKRAPTTE